MNTNVSSRALGLFILGALALLFVSIMTFGGGSLLRKDVRALVVFNGSVSGLTPGAAVTLKGVRIGAVSDIVLRMGTTTGTNILVYLEFDPDKINLGESVNPHDVGRILVERGLRAVLRSQSFVTGQLAVELDYFPGSEATLSGFDKSVPELPTVKAGLDAMMDTLAKLPVDELAQNALASLQQIRALLIAPETRDLLVQTHRIATGVAEIVDTLKTQVGPMTADAHNTIGAGLKAAEQVSDLVETLRPELVKSAGALATLLASLEKQLQPLTSDLRTGIHTAERATTQAEQVMASLSAMLAPRAPLRQDLEALMRNLALSSSRLRSFAEQLDANPNSLLMGKSRR